MKKLLISITVTLVVYLTSAAVVQERSKREESCSKRIPMAEYFEHGYDITEFDVFGCPEIGGKRAKFTVLSTCEKKEKFTSNDELKTEYDIPDEFFTAFLSSSSYMTSGHSYSDMADLREEYIQSTAAEFSHDEIRGLANAKFKNNQFYKEMKTMFARNSKVAFAYYKVGVSGMYLNDYKYNKSHFTPSFNSDINSLPAAFDGNENVYLNFVKKYGTHVLTYGRFGASIYRYAEITQEDVTHGKETDVNWEMRKDAMALNDTLEIICQKKGGHREVLKVHAKNRDYTQVILGGSADEMSYANRSIPVNTIQASPALIASQVMPISKLFEDNKEREANVEKAIKVYMAKAYIKSRVNAIQMYIDSGRKPRDETNAILAKVKQSEEVYNLEELQKLGSEAREEAHEMKRVSISKTPVHHLAQHIAANLGNN